MTGFFIHISICLEGLQYVLYVSIWTVYNMFFVESNATIELGNVLLILCVALAIELFARVGLCINTGFSLQ